MKRTLGSLAILSAALAFCLLSAPGPARAQATATTTNLELPLSTTLENPCAGELIDFTGTMHLVIQTVATPAGTFKATIHSNTQNVSGTGVDSGTTFRFKAVANTTELSSVAAAQETTIIIEFRIIGPGPNNNFLLQETFHVTINANGEATATVNQISLKCE
jgi:hypothetical protein